MQWNVGERRIIIGDLKILFGSKQMKKRTNLDKTGLTFIRKNTLNEHDLPIKRV